MAEDVSGWHFAGTVMTLRLSEPVPGSRQRAPNQLLASPLTKSTPARRCRSAHSFNRCEEQVLGKSGRPAPSEQRRNEGHETVYKGQKTASDDIRQPVRSKWKQPTRQNHGDRYFHQYR